MALSHEQRISLIEEGQRLRGWIANGYAQVEYLLGDIITRENRMDEYKPIADRLPHRIEKRIAKVRQIFELNGFFSSYRQKIVWIINEFEKQHKTHNLLAHGFLIACHTPDGRFELEFRKRHRDGDSDRELIRIFRLKDLEDEKAQLTKLSHKALKLSFCVHRRLGLVGS